MTFVITYLKPFIYISLILTFHIMNILQYPQRELQFNIVPTTKDKALRNFGIQDIYERNLIKSVDDLEAIYKTLKEKCLHPTKDKCANCKETACKSANDIGCILKLFEGFEGFVPQPHQGHEFGDVSMLVKYQGKNMTFQGVVKSVPSGKTSSKITKSSDLGREIIQQTLSAFHDDRVDIIGVIYPNLIDDQLKYFLYHYAKLSNRRLVILDRILC